MCPPAVTRRPWEWGTVCRTRWQSSRLSLCLHPTGEKRCPTSEWVIPRVQHWSERVIFCLMLHVVVQFWSWLLLFILQWNGSTAVQWRVLWDVGILLPRDPFTLHGVRRETKDRRWLRLCPHVRGYFYKHSFFSAVWLFTHTQTDFLVTKHRALRKLLPGWSFSENCFTVNMWKGNRGFSLVPFVWHYLLSVTFICATWSPIQQWINDK